MKLLILFAGLVMTGRAYAQSLIQRAEYAEVGVFVHSFGLPFIGDHFFKLDHLPGLSVGATWPMKSSERWRTDYRMRLSGYMAKGLHKGLHLDNQVIEAYQVSDSFRLEGQAGLGYLHTFESAGLYNLSSGKYRAKRDWGRPQITLSIGLGFSFRLKRDSPYWIFAEQQFMVQVPFASKSGIPLLMHNRSYFGLRREINLKFREL